MIYFIQASSGGPIKIGTTIRLSTRLKQLVREAGEDLRVLAVVDGSFPEESSLHDRFSHLRAFGEWFEPGGDLLGFIVESGREWNGIDEVPPGTEPVRGPRTIGIRCSAEWGDWLDELAKEYRTTVAGLIDRALAEWTKAEGYEKRPPERTP